MNTQDQAVTMTPARWLPPRPLADASSARVRIEQKLRGQEACFMTEKRLNCGEMTCELRVRCRRLVAVWKR